MQVLEECKMELNLAKSLMSYSSTKWILQHIWYFLKYFGMQLKKKKGQVINQKSFCFQQLVLQQTKSPQLKNIIMQTSFNPLTPLYQFSSPDCKKFYKGDTNQRQFQTLPSSLAAVFSKECIFSSSSFIFSLNSVKLGSKEALTRNSWFST